MCRTAMCRASVLHQKSRAAAMSQPKGSIGRRAGSGGEAVATPTPALPSHDDDVTQIAPAITLTGTAGKAPSRSTSGFGSSPNPPAAPLSRPDGTPAPNVDASLPADQNSVAETLPGHVQSGAPESR